MFCYSAALLLLLQVTARPSGPTTHAFQQHQQQQPSRFGDHSSSSGHVTAALGTKWAHAVNVRLILERYGNQRVIKVSADPGIHTRNNN